MPKFYTKAFENRTMYFDLRNGGVGEPEGLFAQPIFAGKELELERKCAREGRPGQLWIELLAYAVESWEGFYDLNGRPIHYSEEKLRELCEANPNHMRSLLYVIRNAASATTEDAEKN